MSNVGGSVKKCNLLIFSAAIELKAFSRLIIVTAMKTIALIVAAGRGSRSGQPQPKQYSLLAGKTVLRHCVENFLFHPGIDGVKVVIHPDDVAAYDQAMEGLDLLPPTLGKAERQGSVLAGLNDLEALEPDHILIHDAARPFTSAGLIDRTLAGLAEYDAVLPSLPIVDTVRQSMPEGPAKILDRDRLSLAQTPQAFHFSPILAAHRQFQAQSVTDDIAIAELAGLSVSNAPGERDNFKITTAEDMERANTMLTSNLTDIRTGSGYDVHAFEAGRDLWLGGVQIDHPKGLRGHSDADVALHALTDALLGAISEADIGAHFPPNNSAWEDASSDRFVDHARALIASHGGRIGHVDLTIICESPRVSPYRNQMRQRIAQILQIEENRVSVKGTTTEKLGFTGRSEGIAAHAVVTVRLPE